MEEDITDWLIEREESIGKDERKGKINKADDMFEKLKYLDREYFENDEYIVYRKDSRKCLGKSIEFHKPTKTIDVGCITMQELQAINEKVKELKWLDE